MTCPRGVDAVGQFWKVVREGVWYCSASGRRAERPGRRAEDERERKVRRFFQKTRKRNESGKAEQRGDDGRTSFKQSFFSLLAAARICPSGLNLIVESGVVMLVKDLSSFGGWKTEAALRLLLLPE